MSAVAVLSPACAPVAAPAHPRRFDAALSMLRAIEWGGAVLNEEERLVPACPWCGGLKPRRTNREDNEPAGHTADCELGRFLGRRAPAGGRS